MITPMTAVDLANKRVLIREDLNVPLQDGKVSNDARIRAAIPTIKLALQQGAALAILSHLGRPKAGCYDEAFSLAPVAKRLETLLNHPVTLVKDWINGFPLQPGQVVLCENVRFLEGEDEDDDALARKMAALGDVFVMDAFGTAHRAQASTHGIAKYAPIACAGPLLMAELDALANAMQNPRKPLLAIVGGSKVSTKLILLESLLDKVDQLIVGGGIANTFLAACGYPVGKSLVEMDLVDNAKSLMAKAKARGAQIPIPSDVVVAKEFSATATAQVKAVTDVVADDMILDIGPKTAELYAAIIAKAGTVVWNGPVGVFEMTPFAHGTAVLTKAIAESQAFSLAGGGDTLAAIDQFGVADKISYISTGGGAFLEFLEGKTLPAVKVLEERGTN